MAGPHAVVETAAGSNHGHTLMLVLLVCHDCHALFFSDWLCCHPLPGSIVWQLGRKVKE